jgi:hypothetical protein
MAQATRARTSSRGPSPFQDELVRLTRTALELVRSVRKEITPAVEGAVVEDLFMVGAKLRVLEAMISGAEL